ncbi:hypothetical protein NYQ35_05260 [Curtobacterium flaccumfaciens pv. flaccumfaciens]|uniref:hypothetical protein n=1 Tax=Curtobacterium flaccumfaciens TaxID=2035 RepID=UPI00217EE790|nr:hypothetical protein [Curtobacterium flaccumfaciens]MCS6568206.1 hypothetical protein [Curtobacterium flaccumfaciens pv. flaccumfaciens]MCS6584308.1 hypothetical protein [Curtobacterium flaccumfaciens pv. flaccumfaciens]
MQEDELERLITADRLRSYAGRTGSSTEALRLYEWNMRAAAAVMELTGVVEVFARNALDRELCAWASSRTGPPWFDIAPLDSRGRADLAKARARAGREGRRPEVHGRVIAELSFGFWRYLVESRYHTSLWVPGLHRAFPHGPDNLRIRRSEVARRLQQLHFVRNRAAHHEPIHARNLQRDHDFALELLGWISPDAASWAEGTTSIEAVLRARPDG